MTQQHRRRRRDDEHRSAKTHQTLTAQMSGSGSAVLQPPRAKNLGAGRRVPASRPDLSAHGRHLIAGTSHAVRTRSVSITIEGTLYIAFIVAAALTRFWDLGKRALHHDESLHAYYSWLLSVGRGFHHDPLMHGPFLFEGNALVYLLFGDSDASTRFLPALTGVLLVAAPWLLRSPNLLGRVGALTASFLLLISPTFLYYTRYIRHDPYTALGTLIFFTSIVRYREHPQRRWLVTGFVSISFLYANHEIVFALVAIFGGFIWAALLWGRLRVLLPLQLTALALAAADVLLMRQFVDRRLPAIPWDNPTGEQERDYYRDLLTHPLTLSLLALGVVFLAACWWLLRDDRRRRGGVGLLDDAAPGSTEHAVRAAGYDTVGISIGITAAVALFAVLFTTFFTNLHGLATGTFATDGTLLYWLGQQSVQRADQPWFFFLILMPQYEFLAIALGGFGVIVTLWQAVRAFRRPETSSLRLFCRLFLTVWFGLIFVALSYAGEKMPWLVMHITLPAILLGAIVVDDLVARWHSSSQPATPVVFGRPAPGWTGTILVIGLLVAAAAWYLLAGRLTYGEFDAPDGGDLVRQVTARAQEHWWLLALPPLAGLMLLVGSWLWRGPSRTGRNVLVALGLLLALLQIHVAWRLAYLQGDTPYDMLMYNQTSPDVTRMMSEIEELSRELTGGNGIVIWYDNNTAWPLQWYLRDYPNRRYYGASLDAAPEVNGVQADILLVANDNLNNIEPYMTGYTAQQYVLRWHFPEDETYRNFAIAPEIEPGRSAWKNTEQPHGLFDILESIRSSLATQFNPDGEQRLYRLVMYRDLPVEISGYNYTLYIRDDLVPLFNTIRY